MQKYTVNDGLSDSYVLSVQQDSQGFLWIGTNNGLSRFDGKEFVNYGYADGLPDLRVDNVYEDHNKRIWAGTRRGMVEVKGRKCISYPTSDGLSIRFVFSMKESADGQLLGMTDKGVYRFAQNRWVKQPLYPGMENQPCRNIIETPRGTLINYGDRIACRAPDGRFTLPGPVKKSKEYYNGVCLFNHQVYLYLKDRVLRAGPADTVPVLRSPRPQQELKGFFIDSKNRYWTATDFDGAMVSAPGHPQLVTDTFHTTYNLVSGFFEDREGNIWIACIDGLMKVREVNYSLYTSAVNGAAGDIRNLVKTTRGIIGCSSYALLEWQRGVLRAMPLHTPGVATARRPIDDIVDAWCTDNRERTWIMTRKRHLYLLDGYTINDISSLAPKPQKDLYWQIAFNPQNRKIYLCSDSLYYGNEQGLKLFKASNTGQYICRPRFAGYFSNGYVLVHTADDAFLLLDAQNRVRDISGIIAIGNAHEGISVYAETSGKFWIGYNGGLVRFRWNEQQLPVKELTLTGRDGLPNDAVRAITTDAFGRVWAVTSAGPVVIEPDSAIQQRPVIHRLGEENGIYGNQWFQTRILTGPDSSVWMNLRNGIYRFNPATLQFDTTPPETAIDDIRLNLHATQWDQWADSLYGYRQLPRQAQLPYYLNHLSLSYRAPCFRGASGVEYSYLLEGADSGWSAPTKNNSVSFVKLPAGHYLFKVRARKSNTGWGRMAGFAFTIRPPYWEQWWFRGCVLVLATALLAVIFRSRIRQVRRKAQVKEQLRELELKALRAQMNPHFIYNALNSIQALVFSHKAEEASLYISKFGRLLRQVLNHSEKALIPLQEELEALELYIQLEQLRLHVDLQYSIQADPALDGEEEWVPPLVLQPFAENALWHGLSRKAGAKKLDITVMANGEWLEVRVTDNGIGRRQAAGQQSPRAQQGSRGMDITGRRLQEYNRIKDTVFIHVTDRYDTAGQPAGTSVLLRIKRKTGQAVE